MTKPEVRTQIRAEVEAIHPFDQKEKETKEAVLRWIDSGVELCRQIKPATPPQHLVSYFIPIDGDYLLLADHIRSGLWLPPGGHVEPGEDPRDTVVREAFEELSLHAKFFHNAPLFLTNTWTVGPAADRHRDVSLWYLLSADRHTPIRFDPREFHGIRWFHQKDIPVEKCDPELGRFILKLSNI